LGERVGGVIKGGKRRTSKRGSRGGMNKRPNLDLEQMSHSGTKRQEGHLKARMPKAPLCVVLCVLGGRGVWGVLPRTSPAR
jgi:hypothetical protein